MIKFLMSRLKIVSLPFTRLSIIKQDLFYILFRSVDCYERLDYFGEGFNELQNVFGDYVENFFSLRGYLKSFSKNHRKKLLIEDLIGFNDFEKRVLGQVVNECNKNYKN